MAYPSSFHLTKKQNKFENLQVGSCGSYDFINDETRRFTFNFYQQLLKRIIKLMTESNQKQLLFFSPNMAVLFVADEGKGKVQIGRIFFSTQ